jgi:hypothetical protein
MSTFLFDNLLKDTDVVIFGKFDGEDYSSITEEVKLERQEWHDRA